MILNDLIWDVKLALQFWIELSVIFAKGSVFYSGFCRMESENALFFCENLNIIPKLSFPLFL